MNDSSAVHAAAIERAASAIEAAKLRVIDRDWSSGLHHPDLVAAPGPDILAAVEVRATAQDPSLGVFVATLTEARFRQATDAARAWMRRREADCEDLWVVLVTVDPSVRVEVAAQNAAEVF